MKSNAVWLTRLPYSAIMKQTKADRWRQNMKRKFLTFAGLIILALTAGCGVAKSPEQPAISAPAVTETPAPAVTEAPVGTVVEMEKVEETDKQADAEHVIGQKTDSASGVMIINQTGDPIEYIFIRAAVNDDGSNDEWGTDLLQGGFEWIDGEKALYYFENNQKDPEGNTATSYDIRISYEDENKSELYYRNLPLPLIKEIRLCLDISGDFGVPYARYITINGNKEYSTLQEVRTWYGLDVEDESEDEITEEETESTPTPTPSATEAAVTVSPTVTAALTPTVSAETGEPTEETTTPTDTPVSEPSEEEYDEPDAGATQAQSYIGQPLENLVGAMGSDSGSEYADEPDTGRTGYHYYGSFTVSTTVDDEGNEIVSGVW